MLRLGLRNPTEACSFLFRCYNLYASRHSTGAEGLSPLHAMELVDAFVDPPLGWHADPHPSDSKHAHIAWVSATGETAYGVVLIYLPWPVGPDLVLWGFLHHLRESDSQGELISKANAPDLPGLRFVAESGQYIIRVNLIVRGWRGLGGLCRNIKIQAGECKRA